MKTSVPALRDPATRLGWHAELDLRFARRGERTAMTLNRHRGPLQVQKALYPEGGRTCHIVVLHPPGGIAAGDELEVRADLGDSAQALLTTPGATKWYRSEDQAARQQLKFSVGTDAVLEWLPRENIFFDGSDVFLGLDIDLQPGAKYVGWDIFCFGRRASGESWRKGRISARSRIRAGSQLLWSEMANLRGSGDFASSSMGLSGFSVSGTFLAARCGAEAVLPELRAVPTPAKSRVGITALPDILVARYLGDSSEDVFSWYTALWTLLRPRALDKIARPPRVWAC